MTLMTRFRLQERVLKDAEQMIPRTRKSLDEALEALEDLVVSRVLQLVSPSPLCVP